MGGNDFLMLLEYELQHHRRRARMRQKRRLLITAHFAAMRRRRLFMLLMIMVLDARRSYNRTVWKRPINIDMFADTVNWGRREWLENTRMSRNTFLYICRELRPYLEKQRTRLRQPIPVEKRVLIAIWRLATNIEFRTLGRMFGVGKSTACEITDEFTRAVVHHLMPRYIRFPTTREGFRDVLDGFRNRWGFPQCGGAIDGTHIPILAPPEHHTDYFNRKGWHSVIAQVVTDHAYNIMDINTGWPGSVHDARVFRNSGIFNKGQAGTLFPDFIENIGGTNVPVFLLGDPAYPLLPWLMKPFPRGNIDPDREKYNNCLSTARMTIENVFGRWKARWRCLLKRNDSDIDKLIMVICTCATLHNICEKHREEIPQRWIDEMVRELEFDQPGMQNMGPVCGTPAPAIREALVGWVRDNR